MQLKNFNLIMMLIAGIIVTIISIINVYTIERLMYTLIVVLLLFFVLGSIIQTLVNGIFDKADDNAREKEMALLEEERKELEYELDQTEDTLE